MKKVEVIPIVVGALGAVSKKLDKWIELEIGNTHKNRTSPKDSIIRHSKNTEKKLGKLKPLGP